VIVNLVLFFTLLVLEACLDLQDTFDLIFGEGYVFVGEVYFVNVKPSLLLGRGCIAPDA
jgi:hypothetical protein